jgi:hypothetical protein
MEGAILFGKRMWYEMVGYKTRGTSRNENKVEGPARERGVIVGCRDDEEGQRLRRPMNGTENSILSIKEIYLGRYMLMPREKDV